MKIKTTIFAASILMLALTACSKNEGDVEQPVDSIPKAATPTQNQPTPPPPQRQIQPTQADVKAAFVYSLTRTAETVPPGPQRDAWFRAEAAKIQSISGTACSSAVIGQPSVCSLIFDGRSLDGVKILLTNAGWIVLP